MLSAARHLLASPTRHQEHAPEDRTMMNPPTTMRGIVRTGIRRVQIKDFPIPQLDPGTALVRVRAAGICGSDLHPYRREARPEEFPSGHEVAGEVVALAPGTTSGGDTQALREGDRVALDTICLGRACGACEWCRQGLPFHCQQKRRGPDWSGSFGEYLKRDVRGLFLLSPGMTWEEGALVEPLAVAVHAVRLAQLQPGESVAILGAGTIGLTCLLAARGLGAADIYVLARYPHQAALARELGATQVLDGTAEEAAAAVRDLTNGRGADVVFESVGGDPALLGQAAGLLRRRGRLALLGLFGHPGTVALGALQGKEPTVLFPHHSVADRHRRKPGDDDGDHRPIVGPHAGPGAARPGASRPHPSRHLSQGRLDFRGFSFRGGDHRDRHRPKHPDAFARIAGFHARDPVGKVRPGNPRHPREGRGRRHGPRRGRVSR
jgi:threonine dehydrogenase-like Zn-dependent dehydrogenase